MPVPSRSSFIFAVMLLSEKPNFGALLNGIGTPETELIQSDDELRTVCARRTQAW